MRYIILEYTYFMNIILYDNISNEIWYLIFEMIKKGNMKYILFSIFKIKIISHPIFFYLKK